MYVMQNIFILITSGCIINLFWAQWALKKNLEKLAGKIPVIYRSGYHNEKHIRNHK